jgi:hypothetical protein
MKNFLVKFFNFFDTINRSRVAAELYKKGYIEEANRLMNG